MGGSARGSSSFNVLEATPQAVRNPKLMANRAGFKKRNVDMRELLSL
jgi:hypothetical protein